LFKNDTVFPPRESYLLEEIRSAETIFCG